MALKTLHEVFGYSQRIQDGHRYYCDYCKSGFNHEPEFTLQPHDASREVLIFDAYSCKREALIDLGFDPE